MALTREQVVAAGLAVLDGRGLDGLTMRAVAEHLNVQHNTIRWHADSKSRLLELMSDALLDDCCAAPLPVGWRDRVKVLADRFRRALLRHRDGARMVAGVTTAEPNTLRYAETMIATLIHGGLSDRAASWTHFGIFYFTLGLTQEEQAGQPTSPLDPRDITSHSYPALSKALPYLNDGSFDQRFDFGLSLLLGEGPSTPQH